MGLVILRGSEERLVGCHERDCLVIGKIDQSGLDAAFLGGAVALQFHIKPGTEQMQQAVKTRRRKARLAGKDRSVERAVGAPGEDNEPIRVAFKPGKFEMRRLVSRMIKKGMGI